MRICLYCRVSTEKQKDEKTIDSQIEELEKWVKEQGHTIVERYIDDGYSGTVLARPELDRLRDDASKKLWEAVVIHSPDRLSREYAWQVIVMEELKSKGIQVLFLNRPIAETLEDQLLLGMQGLIAQFERGKFLERTRRGRLHRAKSGYILGNIPPYGYDCVKKAKSKTGYAYYKINQEEASIVKLMFNLLTERHMTTYGIIMELNHLGIKARHGKRWGKSSVGKILRNYTYTGTTYYNKHYGVPAQTNGNGEIKYHRRKNTSLRLRPKGEWIAIKGIPQIIDKKTFEKAQRQLEANSHFSNRNAKLHYLLKGLIDCGDDLRAYYGIPMHGRPFYRCSGKSKMVSDVICKSPSISANVLEPFVWENIKEFMSNPDLIIQQFKDRQERISTENAGLANRVQLLEQELLKLESQENRYLEAYGSGVITKEQLENQNIKLQDRKKLLISEKHKLVTQNQVKIIPDDSDKKLKMYLVKAKEGMEAFDFDERQIFLRDLLQKITIENRQVTMTGAIPLNLNDILSPQPTTKGSTWCW
ncbi:recombinase family protein [Candidatus Daviesbacteria bacterium]|nr:recombinase family protein [Candidatus Daviesbacteria bacterium]